MRQFSSPIALAINNMSTSPGCQTHVEPNLWLAASDSSSYAYAYAYAYGTDHAIIEGRYITPTQEVNRVQVFGNGVFTEDWEWDEISQVYDQLAQVKDINLNTITKAHYREEAMMREVDIKGLNGTILVPMNCGQDLFDVIAITSTQAGLNASKRRVLSLDRTWTPTKKESRYTLSVGLGAP